MVGIKEKIVLDPMATQFALTLDSRYSTCRNKYMPGSVFGALVKVTLTWLMIWLKTDWDQHIVALELGWTCAVSWSRRASSRLLKSCNLYLGVFLNRIDAFEPSWHLQLISDGSKNRRWAKSLCLSEIMTISIAFHQHHYRNFKHYCIDYVSVYWANAFHWMDTSDTD